MTQVTNYAVPNGPRADVRQGINAVLAALRDCNTGPTEPPNPVPHMIWKDTSGGGEGVYRVRNVANSAWSLLADGLGALQKTDNLASLTDKSAALAQLLTNTALAGLPNAHSNVGFLVTTSNLALGAADVLNTTLWPASQVFGTMTVTITVRGYRPDGTPNVRVALTGTAPSPNGTNVAYLTTLGRIAAALGTYTASAVITKISGVAAGTGLRVSLVEEIAPSTSVGSTPGNAVNTVGSTITSVATRTTTTGNQLRPALQWAYPTGTVLNEVFDIDGLQLEVGSARTPGVFREAVARDAARLMGVGWRLIKTFTVSNVAAVDFTSALLDAPSGMYEIAFDWVVPAVSNANLGLLTSTNGGASFANSAGDYTYANFAANNSATSAPNGGDLAYFPVTVQNISNTPAHGGACGTISLNGLGQARRTVFRTEATTIRQDLLVSREIGGGRRNDAAAVNGLRLLMNPGLIAEGTFSLYEVIR